MNRRKTVGAISSSETFKTEFQLTAYDTQRPAIKKNKETSPIETYAEETNFFDAFSSFSEIALTK